MRLLAGSASDEVIQGGEGDDTSTELEEALATGTIDIL